MSFEIFTLVSGTYSHAAAALINSLQMHGFDGQITVAHSGELNLSLAPDAPVKTIRLDALEKWIGCQKPRLLLNEARGAFAFIDADCVVGSPRLLEIIRDTVPTRPLLAVEAILPHCDYRREGWSHCVHSMLGRKSVPVENIYYNSGFIAGDVTRDAALLREWETMVDQLRDTGDLFRDEHFPMADQDCLNAILQDGTVHASALSPPDIWYAASPVNPFFHVGTGNTPLLLHCTGRNKTWELTQVPTRAPHAYDLAWYKSISHPKGWARSHLDIPKAIEAWLRGSWEGRLRHNWAAVSRRLGLSGG